MAEDIRLRINLDGTQAIRALEQLNRSGTFDRLRASVTTLGTALAASFAAAAGGIIVALQGAVDRADQLSKGSLITGLTTQQLSELAVAGELADASIETIITSLGRLNRAAVEASQGSRAQVEAFTALGVPIRDVNGNLRPTRELLDDVADGLANVRDGATRSALAQELFGKSGAELLPLLGNGSASLREAAAEAREFGLVLSTETGEQAEAFNDNISRLGLVARGAANNLAADLLPALVPVSNKIVEIAKSALDLNARNDLRAFAEGAAISLAIVGESLVVAGRAIAVLIGDLKILANTAAIAGQTLQTSFYLGLNGDENAQLGALYDEQARLLKENGDRAERLVTENNFKITEALRKGFDEQATLRARANPVDPLAGIRNTLTPTAQPLIFEEGKSPADQVGLVALITRGTQQLNTEKSKTTGFDARLKAENAALAEQERRATALANLAQQYDRQQLGRASSLAEGVLTPAEQFRRQVAELNTLVRDGALAQAADRIGVQVEELQRRIILGFADGLNSGVSEATNRANELYQRTIEASARPRSDANSVFNAGNVPLGSGTNPRQAVENEFQLATEQQQTAFEAQLEQLAVAHEQAMGVDGEYYAAVEAARQAHNDRLLEIDRARASAQREITRGEIAAGIDALGQVANAARLFGKRGFAVYMAAAIAQTVISTYSSAVKSYESLASIPFVGPALGGAAAAAAVVNGLGQVARIRAQTANFATGGFVSGPGTRTSDSIPAFLSNGEYVLRADAVSRLGTGFLDGLNSGRFSEFARGGLVGNAGTGPMVSVNVINNSSATVRQGAVRQNANGGLTRELLIEELNDNASEIAQRVSGRSGRRAVGAIG